MGGRTMCLSLLVALSMLVGSFAEPTSMDFQMEPTTAAPEERFAEVGLSESAAMQQCGCGACPCQTACGCVVCPCSQWQIARVQQRNNSVMDMAGRMNPPRSGVPLASPKIIDGHKPCASGKCEDIEPTYGAVSSKKHPVPAQRGKPDPIAPWAKAAHAVSALRARRRRHDRKRVVEKSKAEDTDAENMREDDKKKQKRELLKKQIEHGRKLASKEENHKNRMQLMEEYQKRSANLEEDKETLLRQKLLAQSKQEDQLELSESKRAREMQVEEETKRVQENKLKGDMFTQEQTRKKTAQDAKIERTQKQEKQIKSQGPEKAMKYRDEMKEKKLRREQTDKHERGHKKALVIEQKYKKEATDKERSEKAAEKAKADKQSADLAAKEAKATQNFQRNVQRMEEKLRKEAEAHHSKHRAGAADVAKRQQEIQAKIAVETAKLKARLEKKKADLAAKKAALERKAAEGKQKEAEYKHQKKASEIEVKNVNRKAQEEYKEKKAEILSKFNDIKDAALRDEATQKQTEELREKDFKAPLVEKEMKMKSKCLAKGGPVVISGTGSVLDASKKQLPTASSTTPSEPEQKSEKVTETDESEKTISDEAKAEQEAAEKEIAMEKVVENKFKAAVEKKHRRKMKLALVVARARLVAERKLRAVGLQKKPDQSTACIQALVKFYSKVGSQAKVCKSKPTAGQSLYCYKALKHDRPTWYAVVQNACAPVRTKYTTDQCGQAQANFIKAFAAEQAKCRDALPAARPDCFRALLKKRAELRFPAEKVCALNKKSNMLRVLTLRVRFPRLLSAAQQRLRRVAEDTRERREKHKLIKLERAKKRRQDKSDLATTEASIEKQRREIEEVIASHEAVEGEDPAEYKKKKLKTFKARSKMLMRLYKRGKLSRTKAARAFVVSMETRARRLLAKRRAAFEADRKADYATRGTYGACSVAVGSYFSKANRFGADCLLESHWNRYYCLTKLSAQQEKWFKDLEGGKCQKDAQAFRLTACGKAKSAYFARVSDEVSKCEAIVKTGEESCKSMSKSEDELATCSKARDRALKCFKSLQARLLLIGEYNSMKEACESSDFSKQLRKMTQIREL